MRFILTAKEALTPEIYSFVFQTPAKWKFVPGQFAQLKKPDDITRNSRVFSMASAPKRGEVIFLMKKIPDGIISNWLANAPLGTEVEASIPMGKFTLRPTDTNRVFIATGTGLAPIMSFIESETNAATPVPFILLFGARDEKHLFWTNKLPVGSLITMSRPTKKWRGLRGRVTDHLSALIATIIKRGNAATTGWYLCGSPEMVRDVRTILLAAKIPAANIHFEIY